MSSKTCIKITLHKYFTAMKHRKANFPHCEHTELGSVVFASKG